MVWSCGRGLDKWAWLGFTSVVCGVGVACRHKRGLAVWAWPGCVGVSWCQSPRDVGVSPGWAWPVGRAAMRRRGRDGDSGDSGGDIGRAEGEASPGRQGR